VTVSLALATRLEKDATDNGFDVPRPPKAECAGGIEIESDRTMKAAVRLLSPGGVLVLTQRSPRKWRRPLREAQQLGLGSAYLDVVGGWTGTEYGAEPAFVFVKGFDSALPADPHG
jgi:hypothetical protein